MARVQAAQRREQLLDVAREVFAVDGYRGATALDIARKADVSEALILKHFGTNEGLYRAAVVEPLLALLDRQREDNLQRLAIDVRTTPQLDHELVRGFLADWANAVRDERPLLLALLADLREFPDVAEQLVRVAKQHIDDMARTVGVGTDPDAHRRFDARTLTYVAIAAATLGALMEEDLDGFLDELIRLIFLGVLVGKARTKLAKELPDEAQILESAPRFPPPPPHDRPGTGGLGRILAT